MLSGFGSIDNCSPFGFNRNSRLDRSAGHIGIELLGILVEFCVLRVLGIKNRIANNVTIPGPTVIAFLNRAYGIRMGVHRGSELLPLVTDL